MENELKAWSHRNRNNELTKKHKYEWEYIIDQNIYSERDRAIIKRLLFDNITQEYVAEEFKMSVSQIQRIEKKCIKIIAREAK